MARITVRVIPRSSKNEIRREGKILKVRLTAPPVDGAANEALIQLLAESLQIPRRSLRIVQGTTNRQKIIEVEGLSVEEIEQKFHL